MEPFKNIFNKNSVKELAHEIESYAGNKFDSKSFLKSIYKDLTKLELKDRVRLISDNLNDYLPFKYKKNIDVLIKSLADEDKDNGITGFMTWPLLQYVEDYGLDDFDTSFKAMYEMTKRFSAEFAIRPYIKADEKYVFKILNKWKKDKNQHIRRLCSEGTRPNLPWGMKVQSLNDNLERNIKLIDSLKDDSEEYVRRSVANHLNDISRINESLMLKTAELWAKDSNSKERDWVIRHATRSLLKQGHPKALKLHGYNPKAKVSISKIKLNKKKIKEGDSIFLTFNFKNKISTDQKVLIEYVIHFLKKDGSYSKKPFRLKDGFIKGNFDNEVTKEIKLKKVTTRKHYSGKHKVSVQVNGIEYGEVPFELKI